MTRALILILLFSATRDPIELTDAEVRASYQASYDYEKMEKYEDAIKAIMLVYEAYPETYTVNLRLGWLYYLNGNLANSTSHYKRAISSIPSSVEAMLGLSLPMIKQEKWTEVESRMDQVLSIDFYNYYGNLRLALALRMQKKPDQAATIARKMLALYPTDASFMVELALAADAQGERADAISLFRNVLILDPLNTTAKIYLADSAKKRD